MNLLPLPTEKKFSTQKKAEQWARAFDYARGLLGLPPLTIVHDGDDWIVSAPRGDDYGKP